MHARHAADRYQEPKRVHFLLSFSLLLFCCLFCVGGVRYDDVSDEDEDDYPYQVVRLD